MLISYNGLVDLVEKGYLKNVSPEHINGSSIDIVLGNTLLVEAPPVAVCPSCGHKDHHLRISRQLMQYCSTCGSSHPINEWIPPVDFSKKQPLSMKEVSCAGEGYILMPGEVALAHTLEEYNLPSHITSEYRLKSSMARVFLEHLHAGWVDPRFHGSNLTLEFVNLTRYHPLLLKAGMKCGQVCFYQHEAVPEDRSYAAKGQYNNQKGAVQSGGLR